MLGDVDLIEETEKRLSKRDRDALEKLRRECFAEVTVGIRRARRIARKKGRLYGIEEKKIFAFELDQQIGYVENFTKHIYRKHIDRRLADLLFGMRTNTMAISQWKEMFTDLRYFLMSARSVYSDSTPRKGTVLFITPSTSNILDSNIRRINSRLCYNFAKAETISEKAEELGKMYKTGEAKLSDLDKKNLCFYGSYRGNHGFGKNAYMIKTMADLAGLEIIDPPENMKKAFDEMRKKGDVVVCMKQKKKQK